MDSRVAKWILGVYVWYLLFAVNFYQCPAWLYLCVFLDRVQMIVPLITFCCHADSLHCFVNIPKSDLSFICSFQMQLLSLFLWWQKSLPHVFSNWSKSDPEIFWWSNVNRWHDQIMSLNHVVQMMFICQHLFMDHLIEVQFNYYYANLSLTLAINCSAPLSGGLNVKPSLGQC